MLNNIKSFGLNVIPNRQKTIEHTAESVENAISGLWEPILGYLKENDDVFSGAVMNEIELINNQAARLNMTVNANSPRLNIDYES